jgi:cobalamin-dependent methionine synthase I
MKNMESVIFFEKISIDPPREKIYQRLGYRKRTTRISTIRQKETDYFINEASSLISLKGSLLRLTINHNNGGKINLAGDLAFTSKKLSTFLRDCEEAVFMGATAGNAIMEAIKKKTGHDDLAAAVVYDATASEMTDAALDWIMDYINRLLRREGKVLLPRRFSAGYADFNLENQKTIYEILQMGKIGVTITPSFILIPEKSVTAISGICG